MSGVEQRRGPQSIERNTSCIDATHAAMAVAVRTTRLVPGTSVVRPADRNTRPRVVQSLSIDGGCSLSGAPVAELGMEGREPAGASMLALATDVRDEGSRSMLPSRGKLQGDNVDVDPGEIGGTSRHENHETLGLPTGDNRIKMTDWYRSKSVSQ